MSQSQTQDDCLDIALIGGGIMSATLGALLRAVDPALNIRAFERLDAVALESSAALNNAGTGHAANCELNYTPMASDGSINASKAFTINEQFETSLQFWASLVKNGGLPEASSFINPVPHMSFVWGVDDISFLKKRQETMAAHPFFGNMGFSDDPARIKEWAPLILKGRKAGQKIAATRIERGTDVNFGMITKSLFKHLESQGGFDVELGTDVTNLTRDQDGGWRIKTRNLQNGATNEVRAKFVFIGAGGRALPLLAKSGIPEGRGFGGFPVSGMWLTCKNQEIVKQHAAKVYGKAALGAPPMSVPHLDTRVVDGQKNLLFGPFAGFTTKFLKEGSLLDLPCSLNPGNIMPMLAVGMGNFDLTTYLIGQVLQSHSQRVQALADYFPDATPDDWKLEVAGQRVQIIKKDKEKTGILQFGTEIVVSADHSLAALLGASPGASTSVSLMLELLLKCFPERAKTKEWQAALTQLVPSFGQDLATDRALLRNVRSRSEEILGLYP
ncbi:malate dehydrogenase (quinone) [bacterium M21]|nr:malate dehydrogenase (quinone) [bacterium M21]